MFNGFSFDTTWASNSGITTNLADIGSNSAPAVFYKNNSLYLLSGESTGNFNGYIWDFLNWVPDSIINASLPDVGDYSTPAIFYKGANLYLRYWSWIYSKKPRPKASSLETVMTPSSNFWSRFFGINPAPIP